MISASAALQIPAEALVTAFNAVAQQGTFIGVGVSPSSGAVPLPGEDRAEAVIDWRDPAPGKWSAVIGWTGFRVIVHSGNPINDISSGEVRRIFQGRTVRWEEIGAPPGDIHPVALSKDADEEFLFEGIVLAGGRVAPGTIVAPDARTAADAVSADPLAIGFVLGYQPISGVHLLTVDNVAPEFPAYLSGKYPLRVPIFLVAAEPVPDELLQFAGWAQSVSGQTVLLELHEE